jgi:SnoaL-like domain
MDDIEHIKQLKARYFRTMDLKDWTAMRGLFAEDVTIDTTQSGGGMVEGADTFMEFLQGALDGVVTVHHGHTPEIALSSATTATGIWAMEDMLRWPDGSELHGYGHYTETYVKADDAWLIRSSTLSRLRMDFTAAPEAGSPA